MEDISAPALLLALAAACAWGALHALTPGHGKTIVAAYLVGARGTPLHALYLGLTTTITHTAGVFALGLVTLLASQAVLPELLYPWLSFLSGLLVVGIGVNLFHSRLKAARRARLASEEDSHSHEQDHSHAGHVHPLHHPAHHSHSHDGHPHPHPHPPEHSHLPPGADGSPVTWRSLLALGISGGLLPCPSALVVLLSAIALDRAMFGLLLVLAFSLGLAGVLTGIGLALVYTRRLFDRLPAHLALTRARALRLLPAASALFIALAGLGIAAKALMDMGLIRL
jgi:ABC-type nickel/cobalt efflux system permease component RcnA